MATAIEIVERLEVRAVKSLKAVKTFDDEGRQHRTVDSLIKGAEADAEVLKTMLGDIDSVLWMLLMELEGSLNERQAAKKLDIEAGYRLWNRIHGTNLIPNHLLAKQ